MGIALVFLCAGLGLLIGFIAGVEYGERDEYKIMHDMFRRKNEQSPD